MSTRFVAAMTIIPSLTPKPSISTSIWFNVCSRSSWPPPIPVPRRLATASISSINTIHGAFFSRPRKDRVHGMRRHRRTSPRNPIRRWRRTGHLPLRQPPSQEVSYRFQEGPQGALPSGSSRPHPYISSDSLRNQRSLQLFLLLSQVLRPLRKGLFEFVRLIFARLFPKFIILEFPPPPMESRFININMNMRTHRAAGLPGRMS